MKLIHILLALPLVACATAQPPKELVDARIAYNHAASAEATSLVPAELHVAKRQLELAEQKFADDPESSDVRDAAYVAQRKAQRAEVLGAMAAANDAKKTADAAKVKTQEQIIANQEGKLADAHDQIANTQNNLAAQKQQTEAERQKRVEAEAAKADAEKKAKDAMDALAKSLEVKSDPRGMVITLSGGVVFATNKAEILPGAQSQLNQVAEALKTQAEHHFSVEGHTDNQGTDAINNDLSLRRANAVKDYLIVHGVAAATITAQGFGSQRPIADNKSPEGRAMNRRVEIVVDRPVTASR